MGESPIPHASGFHHPALAKGVFSISDSPFNAFAYHLEYYHKCLKNASIFSLFVRLTQTRLNGMI